MFHFAERKKRNEKVCVWEMPCQMWPLVIVLYSKATGQKEVCVGSGRGRNET